MKFKDDNGPRITIWVHDIDLNRKTMIGLSKQGVSIYKMDPYSDPAVGSNVTMVDGDVVTVKLTGLGSDPLDRSYLAIDGAIIYKHGFGNFYKTGTNNTLRIEAVGSPDAPSTVKVRAIRVRTHEFSPEDDSLSIDDTKPKAVIV